MHTEQALHSVDRNTASASSTHAATSLAAIARVPHREPGPALRLQQQVIVLDFAPVPSALRGIRLGNHGMWLRCAAPLASGTATLMQLVLPDQLAPLLIEGTVVSQRTCRDGGHPWMFIWFDLGHAGTRQAVTQLIDKCASMLM